MFQKTKCLVCLILTTVLVITTAFWPGMSVSATESPVQPRYSYTSSVTTSLNIVSSSKASCTARVVGYSNVTKIHIDMQLQQYLALQWTTIGVWETTINDDNGIFNKTKSLTSSGNYRVKAVYTVYSGSASEKITMYSPERYYTRA